MAEAQIDKLSLEIDYQAGQSATGLTSLSSAIEKIKSVTSTTTSSLTKLSSSISKVSESTQKLSSIDTDTFASKFNSLRTSISSIKGLEEPEGLKKTLNQLNRIPKVLENLDSDTVEKFTTRINSLTNALEPLANNLEKVQGNISNLPSKLNKVNGYANKSAQSFNLLKEASKLLNLGVMVGVGKRLGTGLSDLIKQSTEYGEALNLFNVSMGETSKQAKDFVDNISGVLGLDPEDMMKNMGVFNIMAEGFGIASDKAYIMSKNLTQLTYDIGSFYNIDFETASLKVKSALAGELEPVRNLGFALDQATLQQIAYANGINQSYTSMTQAQKAQLRYIALMTQITEVQGDLGRTLTSPANALRVLQQQFTLLGREIGNIFIPLLTAIVPVAIAVARVLTKLAHTIASLFGYELPDLNWDSVSTATGGIATDLDDANGSAKELRKQLAGFDELNNLTTSDGEGGAGVGNIGTGDLGLDLPQYDMLKGYSKGIDDLTNKVMKFFGLTEDASGKLSWSFADMDTKAKILAVTLGGLVAIKLASWLSNGVTGVVNMVNNFNLMKKAFLAGTSAFGTAIDTVFKFFSGSKLSQLFIDFKLGIAGMQDGIIGFGTVLKTVAPPLARFGSLIGGVVLGVKGFKTTANVFNKSVQEVANGQRSLNSAIGQGLLGFTEFAGAGALIGTSIAPGIGTAIGTIIGSIVGMGDAWTEKSKLIKQLAMENIYGTIELTDKELDQIHQKIVGNIDEQIIALNNYGESTKSATTAFTDSMSDLDEVIYKYQVLGKEISGIGNEELLNALKSTGENATNLVKTSTDNISNSLMDWFSNTNSLTADEQKDILTKVKEGGDARQKKIDSIEQEIYTIYENGIKSRGYLNDEELQAIRNHYKEIADLTSSELQYAGIDLNRVLNKITSSTESLTAESAQRLNQEITSSTQEVNNKIDELYNNRINLARSTAQQLYDDAIASGKSMEEAQKTYNDTYDELEKTALADRQKQQEEANEKISKIRDAFYGKLLTAYANYSTMEQSSMSEVDKKTKQTLQQLLIDAGYTKEQLGNLSYQAGQKSASELQKGYGRPSLQMPTIQNAASSAWQVGQNIGNNIKGGISNVFAGFRITSSNYGTGGVWQQAVKFTMRGFASGGFPDNSEIFMARENGIPELVGRIGNKTAVSNNDQIIEGIKQGVYEGMSNANANQSSTPLYNIVNIGNRKVYEGIGASIRSENNRYGRNVVEV